MKAKRVDCMYCEKFIEQVLEDENNIFSPIKEKAKCKLGKRIMFRQPIFNRPTNMVASNDYGYIRYCEDYERNT